jgi:hypothetical protein
MRADSAISVHPSVAKLALLLLALHKRGECRIRETSTATAADSNGFEAPLTVRSPRAESRNEFGDQAARK